MRFLRLWAHIHFGAALGLLAWMLSLAPGAHAHGFEAGALRIDHPYALPTDGLASHGKVFFRGLHNGGKQPDALVGAQTPVADTVQLHRLAPDARGLRGLPVQAIELPPGQTLRLRHDGDYQLSLIDLKAPLKDGDRFDLTLRFRHAPEQTVKVWVQTPRQASGAHMH